MGLALRIIEQLASSPTQQGVTELANALGASKWRLFRHIHTLREEGFVLQDARTEKFELGSRFYGLTRAIPRRFRFLDIARPAMVGLQRDTGCTVVVAGLVDDKMVVLDTESGAGADPLVVARGKPHDLHASAHGKVALAFGPPALLEETLMAPLRRYTSRTITDPDRLRRIVAQVRKRGWATALEEGPRTGMNVAAAPILASGPTFEGSIGFIVPGPACAARSREIEDGIEALTAAAEAISRRLGLRP